MSFPRQKLVMTQPMEIPMYGKFSNREIQKEDLIDLWTEITSKNQIDIQLNKKVEAIQKTTDGFIVQTQDGAFETKRVLLSIGRRGTPRKLGVMGEMSSKVAYKLLDPEQYKHKHLLVVGGGDSAVEAALRLGEQDGTTVTLSYRNQLFSRIKEKNRQQIESAEKAGWVKVIFNSQVKSIHTDFVELAYDDAIQKIQNDFVFVFIGGELPNAFLSKIGIEMETKFGVQ